MEIEKDQGTRGTKLPRAARQVYAWKGNRAVDGSESVEVLRKGLADGPYGMISICHAKGIAALKMKKHGDGKFAQDRIPSLRLHCIAARTAYVVFFGA